VQEVLVRLRVRLALASGSARDLTDSGGAQACKLFLTVAALFDVRLDEIPLRAAEVFGQQSFELPVGGAPA
jgi:hypothetical protein